MHNKLRCACARYEHVVTPSHNIFPYQKVLNTAKEIFTSKKYRFLWELCIEFINELVIVLWNFFNAQFGIYLTSKHLK